MWLYNSLRNGQLQKSKVIYLNDYKYGFCFLDGFLHKIYSAFNDLHK